MGKNKKEDNKDGKKLKAPFASLTTIRRFGILIVTFIVAYLPDKTLGISSTIRSIIIGVLLLVWLFLESASLRLGSARKALYKGQKEKGWKALNNLVKHPVVPLSFDEKLQIATMFIQHGEDPQIGIECLEKLLNKTKKEYNRIKAANSLSLGYYRQGNIEGAIDLLKNYYDDGITELGLLVNYSSFLLANGESEKAFDVILKGGNNIYILDNLGVYYLVNGMHKEAIELYRKLYDNTQPRFVEFYIHAFQSELYYQCKSKALDRINTAFSCPRIMTSKFDKDYIERLKKAIDNAADRNKVNASPALVAFGEAWTQSNGVYEHPCEEDIKYYNTETDDDCDYDIEEESDNDAHEDESSEVKN